MILDTHVLVWLRFGDDKLGARTRDSLKRAWLSGDVAVSAVSFWEVAMLHEKGRLTLLQDIGSWRQALLQDGIVEIPVDGEIGIRATGLVDFHADPADRLIVATALGGHQLVTADERILDWPGALNSLRATD
jgi:PIN domain nuclease of toxin-antitoxin system